MTITPQQVLDCPMGDNDAYAANIREYLVCLLRLVWTDGENFDGKRPFGNSVWWAEPVGALVEAGLVEGGFDEYGRLELEEDAQDAADALILGAIEHLGGRP